MQKFSSNSRYITDVFEIGDIAFYGCDNATLYVPKGLVDTYKSTADWNRFSNIEEMPGISLALACSDHGKVTVNDTFTFSTKIAEATVYDGIDSKFVFSPDANCRLDRVLINGLDVTKSVSNNELSTTILPNSSMMVIFSSNSADVNGDGVTNISDVIEIVNLILNQ